MQHKIRSIIFVLLFSSCSKEEVKFDNIKDLLSGHKWYLEYSIQDSITQSYVGATTYYIHFFKNDSTSDSDGIKGIYLIQQLDQHILLQVTGETINHTPIQYQYQINEITEGHLRLTHQEQNRSIIKIFSTR